MATKEKKAIGGALSGAIQGGATGGVAGAITGGLLGGAGGLFGGDDEDNSAELARIQALWDNLYVPTQEDLAVAYNDFGYVGDITPQMLQAEQLAANDAYQNINVDPRLKQTQMNQLDTLSKIAGAGFTPDELASMEAARMQREADVSSKMKQMLQQQDARGVGNSDMALAQRMMEAQSAANRGAADARQEQAEAYKRSLNAITAAGTLAGNMGEQDYSRQADLAKALNTRENTNLSQRANTNTANVDAFNKALESNRNLRQDVSNKTTGSRNAQMDANSRAFDRAFNMGESKVRGQVGAVEGQMKQNDANQAADNALWSGVINSATQGAQNFFTKSADSDKITEKKAKP